jgi:hypothetical protein
MGIDGNLTAKVSGQRSIGSSVVEEHGQIQVLRPTFGALQTYSVSAHHGAAIPVINVNNQTITRRGTPSYRLAPSRDSDTPANALRSTLQCVIHQEACSSLCMRNKPP